MNDAIQCYRDSIHISEALRLRQLASALRTRCKFCGRHEDIDEAIECLQKALSIAAPDIKPSILNNLGNALNDRFSIFHSKITDLDTAAAAFTESIELRFPTDESRAYPLTNLANTLNTRFRLTGNLETLNQAIGNLREALRLRPPGHPERKGTLNVLGTSLRTRSGLIDYSMTDLDESINYHREAASLHAEKSPGRYSPLHNLANGLRIRFAQRGDKADLEESIHIDQGLLDTYPKTHPDRSKFIIGIATSFRMSFERSGDEQALDDAIRWGQEAILLTHETDFTALNSYANLFRARYNLHGALLSCDNLRYTALNSFPKGELKTSNSLVSTLSAHYVAAHRHIPIIRCFFIPLVALSHSRPNI